MPLNETFGNETPYSVDWAFPANNDGIGSTDSEFTQKVKSFQNFYGWGSAGGFLVCSQE